MTVTASNGAASNPSQSSTSSSSGMAMDKLANEQTFLQLFVAQLQNQDPLNPQDGAQFVAQLAEFSNLEQSLQMRQDLDAIRQHMDNIAGQAKAPASQGS